MKFMEPFVSTLIYFFVAVGVVLVGLVIFELITTRYKDWDEILKGNHAVALSIGGKIVGICIILAFSIYNSADIVETLIWGGVGIVLQMVAYLLFQLFTRNFSVEEQLHKGNIAVGIISMCVSIGLGFVIGASIT
jgi:putative membrane protein